MTVTAGPEISMSDLHAEFGGTGPISDYYKNGGLVPSTRPEWLYGGYNGPYYSTTLGSEYYWLRVGTTGNFTKLYFNGTLLENSSDVDMPIINGLHEYSAQTMQFSGGGLSRWDVRRRTASYPTPLPQNDDVPTGGVVALSDFYGSVAY